MQQKPSAPSPGGREPHAATVVQQKPSAPSPERLPPHPATAVTPHAATVAQQATKKRSNKEIREKKQNDAARRQARVVAYTGDPKRGQTALENIRDARQRDVPIPNTHLHAGGKRGGGGEGVRGKRATGHQDLLSARLEQTETAPTNRGGVPPVRGRATAATSPGPTLFDLRRTAVNIANNAGGTKEERRETFVNWLREQLPKKNPETIRGWASKDLP
ncbi:hypothetical protein BE15_10165 [Sorangium cellulosum]|uniref:Uncharacterized protein n=1 Tax=Sorangium cellulosum TaxID=56 RepID=A0A150QP42_SORCE|nr:hypothetical protein BE15_10165 [Sorangium cellulosum]